jgi:TctA family transporter
MGRGYVAEREERVEEKRCSQALLILCMGVFYFFFYFMLWRHLTVLMASLMPGWYECLIGLEFCLIVCVWSGLGGVFSYH